MNRSKSFDVGQTITTSSMRLTRVAALCFAHEFDPQSIHTSDETATMGFFGKLTASGWYALCLTMRLCVDAKPFGDAPLVGAELCRIRFKRPIWLDIEIAARITFREIQRSQGKLEYNILNVETFDILSEKILIEQQWKMVRI